MIDVGGTVMEEESERRRRGLLPLHLSLPRYLAAGWCRAGQGRGQGAGLLVGTVKVASTAALRV